MPLDVKLCQLVRLFKGGEPFKMSKRAGTFVTLRDVIEQVGPDVTRFVMLTRKNDAPLDFDFDKVLEQSKDNPVFYVQYAHARAHSVLARAAEAGFDDRRRGAGGGRPRRARARRASCAWCGSSAEWPRQVEIAAAAHEPHRIAFYLYDLASEFHALQHQGKLDPGCGSSARTPALRALALVRATQVVAAARLLGARCATRRASCICGRACYSRRDPDGRDAVNASVKTFRGWSSGTYRI